MVYLVFMKKTMVFGFFQKNMVFANPGPRELHAELLSYISPSLLKWPIVFVPKDAQCSEVCAKTIF